MFICSVLLPAPNHSNYSLLKLLFGPFGKSASNNTPFLCDYLMPPDLDTDGDNIIDSADTDDDNDGIPDTEEGGVDEICPSIGGASFPAYDYTNCSVMPGGRLFTNIGTFNGNPIDMTLDNIPGTNLQCGIGGTLGCNTGDNGFTLNNTDFGSVATLSFYISGTSIPISINWAVFLDDFDLVEGVSINSTDLSSYQVNVNNGMTVTDLGSQINFDSGDDDDDEILFFFREVSSVSFEFTHTVNNRSVCFASAPGFVPANPDCVQNQVYGRDSDGDGIFDHLDLDSDNDGIYDLHEAGHTAPDLDNNGIIDGNPAEFGLNGLYDNLETLSDNDMLNYAIANSESIVDGIYDAYELDADGDGCYDTEEEGIYDPEDDGIAGIGTAAVDTLGRVLGILYTMPSIDTWQNPLRGPCIPEVCGDGIDNDMDGLSDCADDDCITSPYVYISTNSICINEIISLSSSDLGSGTLYSWSFGADATPASASGIGPHDVSYSSCGTKTISLEVSRNSCTLQVDSLLFVVDNTAPSWNLAAQDLIMECNPTANYPDSIAAWLANYGNGVLSDNCGSFAVTNNYTGLSIDCGSTSSAIVNFTATDNCGNSSSSSAAIRIIDSTPPTFTSLVDLTVTCDTIPAITSPLVSDNCDDAPIVSFNEVIINHPSESWRNSASCVILSEVSAGVYDDNGTPGTADDVVRFNLTVIGRNTSSAWSTTINGVSISGGYFETQSFGPFPSDGSLMSFNIMDGANAACSDSVVIDPTAF